VNYIEFRNKFYELGCFYVHQIYAWYPKFDKSNLTRWVKKGLLIKLKNGYYSFPEYLHYPDFSFFVSNKIYRPSYISLHSALAFYGIIPEAVSRTTAVSAMKKMTFENRFGVFTYQQIAPHLMFGYDIKPFSNEQTILFAFL
jgi:predicted transcriptional regulator of viral defense system